MKKDIVRYTDENTGEQVLANVLMRFENGDVRTDRDGIRTRNEITSVYTTTKETVHRMGPRPKYATFPAGTEVYPANNLPDGGYWICFVPTDDETIESWFRTYGFWVSEDEVDIELPF